MFLASWLNLISRNTASHCFFCPVLMGTLQPQNSSSKAQGWPCLSCSTQMFQWVPQSCPCEWGRSKRAACSKPNARVIFFCPWITCAASAAQRKQLQPQIRQLNRPLHSPSISLWAFLWTIQKKCLITFSSLRSKWVNLPKYAIHALVSEG